MVDGSVQIKDLTLVGMSGALRSVDGFIEKAARADCPVLIQGEFGVGKKHVAYALHMAGLRHDHPFVHVRCDALDALTSTAQLADLFRQTDGGTIFFDGIGTLAYALQCQLAEVLESGVGSGVLLDGHEKPVDARIVASAGSDLKERVQGGTFSQALLEELHYLPICLTPLRERREDIKPLASYFLSHYAGNGTRALSDGVVALLEAYHWPRNVSELKRVVARLAVMADGETIGLDDVYAHAPELLVNGLPAGNGHRANDQPRGRIEVGELSLALKPLLDAQVCRLAQALIDGEEAAIRAYHPGLQKALTYLAHHYAEKIPLSRLAQQACLSRSHLSYLFKQGIGVSFKPFLAAVRIEKAMRFLVEKPHFSITRIGGEVGYSDLRHFERTFKRWAGSTPRAYRQSALLS